MIEAVNRWLRPPWGPPLRAVAFTLSIALFNVLLFEAAWIAGGDEGVKGLFGAGTLDYGSFREGEWWRLLTMGVVHRDWDHLLSNTLILVLLGLKLEPMIGSAATAWSYLLAQIASSAAIVAFQGGGGGASGAIFGLGGVVLAHPFRNEGDGRLILSRTWPLFLLCHGYELSGEPDLEIAFGAHLAGFLCGLVFGAFVTSHYGRTRRPSRMRLAAVGAVVVGLLVAVAPLEYWSLERQYGRVYDALLDGDGAATKAHLRVAEQTADPRSLRGAQLLKLAATFRSANGDLAEAQAILGQVAPTLGEADVFRDLGLLQTMADPGDPRGAEASFRSALELEPSDPATLNALAMLFVFGDSTQYSPARARALARSAVEEDGALTMEYFVTLAWAEYECGSTGDAIDRMRYVVKADTTSLERRLGDLRTMERRAAAGS